MLTIRTTIFELLGACAIAVIALLAPWGSSKAVGAPTECNPDAFGHGCTIHAEDPGNPGWRDPTDGDGSPRPDPPKSTCNFNGRPMPCSAAGSNWSNAKQCWVKPLSPQPEPTHLIWDGRTDGVIYECSPPDAMFSAGGGRSYWFWSPSPPELVNPSELALQAIEQMHLRAPQVGMTPVGSGAESLVGVPTWLWVENASKQVTGPISRSARAGSVTVTADARVDRVVWDMGDGTTVTCRNTGTRWTPARGTGRSPTCGHRYTRPSTSKPGGAYRITSTTHWRVDWRGAGQSGVITFAMSDSRRLPVTEVHVLQTG